MPNLTDTLIRAAKPPERGQTTITDSTLPNFGIRLSQGGSKTFVVTLGQGRRQTIGHYPTISLADARKEARRILAERELGRIRPQFTAFDDAKDAFLADRGTRNLSRTVKDYTRLLRHFPYGRTALADITGPDLLRRLAPLPPSEKRHAFVAGRVFFNWCVRQHLIERSPMENLDVPHTSPPRERVLTPDELKAVYLACNDIPSPFAHVVQLLILTGQRRGEIVGLQWSWVDEEKWTITFPSTITKNKRTHTIPYGKLTFAIIAMVTYFSGHSYLFPAARILCERTTTFNGWGKAKAALDKASGVTDRVLHDLRRSYASTMQMLGVRIEVTERLLGHVSGTQSGIVGVYQRHHFMPEMKDAVLRYEEYLHLIEPTA